MTNEHAEDHHQSPIATTIIPIMVTHKTRRGVWSSWRAGQRYVALLRGDVLPGGTSFLHLQTGRLVEHLEQVEHVTQAQVDS